MKPHLSAIWIISDVTAQIFRSDSRKEKQIRTARTIKKSAARCLEELSRSHDAQPTTTLVPFAASREKSISRKDAKTRRELIQNRSDNNEIQGTDVLNDAHVPITHNECDSCSLRGFVWKKHLTQRRQDAKRPKEAMLQQKNNSGVRSFEQHPRSHDAQPTRFLFPLRLRAFA